MGHQPKPPSVKLIGPIKDLKTNSNEELIKVLENVMTCQEWQAGGNPENMDNPWEFKANHTFTTLKDEHHGEWEVEEIDSSLVLSLKWISTTGWAKFQFTEITRETAKISCFDTEWSFMLSWKLIPNPMSSADGQEVTLHLAKYKSDNESSVILSKKTIEYGGHTVNYLQTGNSYQAVTMFRTKQPHGEFFRLNHKRANGMDCAFGKYHDGNEVNSWHLHRGGNQLFMVNNNQTISPTFAPDKFWGYKNGNLRLVNDKDDTKLIFKDLQPSNQDIFKVPLTAKNFPGLAIIYSGKTKQWPHGQETHLKIGPTSKAMNAYLDSQGFLVSYELPYQAFDGYQDTTRPVILFTKHCEYGHQRYVINDDNTISLRDKRSRVLGHNGKSEVVFVNRGDKMQIVFQHVHKLNENNQEVKQHEDTLTPQEDKQKHPWEEMETPGQEQETPEQEKEPLVNSFAQKVSLVQQPQDVMAEHDESSEEEKKDDYSSSEDEKKDVFSYDNDDQLDNKKNNYKDDSDDDIDYSKM